MTWLSNKNNMGGLSIIFFIIVVALSMGFYQFIFLDELNATPSVPEDIANPPEVAEVLIVEGSGLPSNPQFYVPEEVRGALGVDNKILWINEDTTAHTVTTDDEFHDQLNGKFDSMETIGLLTPGQTYEFTFTEEGEYPYHCEPHPWMTGMVKITKSFA